MRAAIVVIVQNRISSIKSLPGVVGHSGSFSKPSTGGTTCRSLSGTLAFLSSSITTKKNVVAGISNTTDSSRSNLVHQSSINYSNTGNKTTTHLFGTVIGITSALALSGGLYIEHQKARNLIQNVTTVQIDNNTNISQPQQQQQHQHRATASATTALLIDLDVDKHQVVELQEHHHYQDPQQQPLYHHSRNIRLLSTSPVSPNNTEFVDEYDNLPETDEPTTCFMCRTYRQGPCRTVFRKFYQCVIDNKENNDGDNKCSPYTIKFEECEESYYDLYELVQLDLYQEYIDFIEEDMKEVERRCWPINSKSTGTTDPIIHMDWGNWPNFVAKEGLNYTQVNNNTDSTLPLWKRFPDGVNPILLSGKASVPCTIDDTNKDKQQKKDFILKEVWVTDQDGMLLGHSRNKKFVALKTMDIDDDNNDIDDDNNNNSNNNKEESDDDSSSRCTCIFQIIPGCTKQVTVHGIFCEYPLVVASETEAKGGIQNGELLVYSSTPYCMEKAATE